MDISFLHRIFLPLQIPVLISTSVGMNPKTEIAIDVVCIIENELYRKYVLHRK